MNTDKTIFTAVGTVMHMAPRRESGDLEPHAVDHLQRAEEMLLTLPARQLLGAFLSWNANGRPIFACPPSGRSIPGTSPEEERRRGMHARFNRRRTQG